MYVRFLPTAKQITHGLTVRVVGFPTWHTNGAVFAAAAAAAE